MRRLSKSVLVAAGLALIAAPALAGPVKSRKHTVTNPDNMSKRHAVIDNGSGMVRRQNTTVHRGKKKFPDSVFAPHAKKKFPDSVFAPHAKKKFPDSVFDKHNRPDGR